MDAIEKQSQLSHFGDKLNRFPKGVSGNPTGKKKGTLNSRTLIAKLWGQATEVTLPNGKVVRAPRMAKSLLKAMENAEEGDVRALKELLDRFEGTVPKRVEFDDGTGDKNFQSAEEEREFRIKRMMAIVNGTDGAAEQANNILTESANAERE